MWFNSLLIKNLRAVEHFEVSDLGGFVVIAGGNGSGKSCVFDAIRLLKSIYGGYAPDEHLQWFGELGINVQDKHALKRMFRDSSAPIEISAEVELAQSESDYVSANAEDLASPVAWQRVTGQRVDAWTFNRMAIATQVAQYQEALDLQRTSMAAEVRALLKASRKLVLALRIDVSGAIAVTPSLPAELAFQTYQPDALGVIEYHSASRAYTRQELGGINLDSRTFEDQRRQQSLYNWQAKYQNVKTELASSYMRSLISEKATPGETLSEEDLNETLKELFQTFFPDKVYLGVRPVSGGSLEFPVRVPGGWTHDIDDLSSGEKEILYGYLRLRNSTPANSVILLDEPELHLNPSLLQGYADFYYRHLGIAKHNQLWLVTHSDTLLRQAVGNSNYRVYHMTPAAVVGGGNQASEVVLDDEVDKAMIDLVGDLATYRPHAKVVILEGQGSDGFDVTMTRRLFPDFARRVNLVSGGNKNRVQDLYKVLETSASQAGAVNRFFSIVDRDSLPIESIPIDGHENVWDVYHIENYLLNLAAIRLATNALGATAVFDSDEAVDVALQGCASEIVERLVLERVQGTLNRELVGQISLGASPDTSDVAVDLMPSLTGSRERLERSFNRLTLDELERQASEQRLRLQRALVDDTWKTEFPARLILKRFVAAHVPGVGYEAFRNLVLDKMAENETKPAGMQTVIQRILAE